MLVEGAFTILFAFDYPSQITSALPILCLCLTTSMWLITFSHITPLHDNLTADGLNKESVEKLVQMSWIRTIGWTVKMILLFYCVSQMVFLI